MRTHVSTQGGNTTAIVLAVVVILIIGGGVLLFDTKEEEAMQEDESMMEEGTMSAEDSHTSDAMESEDENMMFDEDKSASGGREEEEGATMEEEDTMKTTYQGEMLAGSSEAPLLAFNKSDYDRAVASGNLVALYFYANWCPICKAEFPKMEAVFDGLSSGGVVGFRVNYNDNETDADEEALAREFGVAYQHTKVFVKNGERVLKSPEGWEQSRYLEEINKFTN